MSDIQDRTLWMIEHNLVPTEVHLECARAVFKKARAFDIINNKNVDTRWFKDIQVYNFNKLNDKTWLSIYNKHYPNDKITEDEFNILKEALADNGTNL